MTFVIPPSNRFRTGTKIARPLPSLSDEGALQTLRLAYSIWHTGDTSTHYLFNSQYQLIQSLYVLREPEKTKFFLEAHVFLLPLLAEIRPQIDRFFPQADVFLSVESEPEVANEQQLIVSISTPFIPQKTLSKLKQFDEEYWLDISSHAYGKICVTVEFK